MADLASPGMRHGACDAEEAAGLSADSLLGGRLRLMQDIKGHRAGTDAVLLAAAAGEAEAVIDLGCGVGTVGLALLALQRARRAILVERDPRTAGIARRNVSLNGFSGRAEVIEADLTSRAAALRRLGLRDHAADLVVANPPFNEPGKHRASTDPGRAAAHEMSAEAFDAWAKTAARLIAGQGRLAVIHRPEALEWLLPSLGRRFGDISVRPVHPQAEKPASRVLISARLNRKGPTRILPALVLHQENGAFTELTAAIHAGERAIDL